MSAIAGIIGQRGRQVDPSEILRMLSALHRRGPDARGSHVEGSVGLGQVMLRTTPEATLETLPNRFGHERLVITADARIDNRDELVRLLAIPQIDAPHRPDSELILKAFAKWGAGALDRLLGDFAFAVYDEDKRVLTLACDPFGIRQVYYVDRPDYFAFASEIKALLTLNDVPRDLDDDALVAYFVPELLDAERTPYASIKRLLPGHCMEIGPDGIRIHRYFELEPEIVPQDHTDGWYVEAFLDRFHEAVKCRMRSNAPIGAELSGGLDSSFVACTAADLRSEAGEGPLWTFSNVYDHVPECDERLFIQEVLNRGNLQPHFAVADGKPHRKTIREILESVDDGRLSGQHQLVWNTARAASKAGARVLLTGHDGDTTVGHGLELFYEWARAGRWQEFGQSARQYVAHLASEDARYARNPRHGIRVNDVANGYARDYLAMWARQGRYVKLIKAIMGLNHHIGLPLRPIPGFLLNRRRARQLDSENVARRLSILRPEILRQHEVMERLEAHSQAMRGEAWRTARSAQALMFGTPQVALNLRTFAEYGGAWGVELRHPFMDRRLIEFCLGMPPTQSFRGGRSRAVMRDAMHGIVPDRVATRPGKTDLAPLFRYLWRDVDKLIQEIPATTSQFLDRWVNRERVAELSSTHKSSTNTDLAQLAAYATISAWRSSHEDMVPSSNGAIGMGKPLSAAPVHGSIIPTAT